MENTYKPLYHSDINETFIIETLDLSGATIFTACTGFYSNALVSCSGDTQILMGTGIISFDGNLYTNDNLTASTINASTFYSGGTNLFNIIDASTITGGTFDNNVDTLSLFKTNGDVINVTGFTDYYTTGATLIGNTVYFDRTDVLSAYTVNLSVYSANTYTTGITYNNNVIAITRNDDFSMNTLINSFTGLTISGQLLVESISATTAWITNLSANTISATTITTSNDSSFNGIKIGRGSDNHLTNTVVGGEAFVVNSGGTQSTVVGYSALNNNVSGDSNTAIGYFSLFQNISGYSNTAIGRTSLMNNIDGFENTGLGQSALFTNSSGSRNTAVGRSSSTGNVSGSGNTTAGYYSLAANRTGNYNIGLGYLSGRYLYDGVNTNIGPNNSIFICSFIKSLTSGDTNQIVIGYEALGRGSNTIQLGNSAITETHIQGLTFLETTPTIDNTQTNLLTRNSNGELQQRTLNSILSGITDYYVTGGTFSNFTKILRYTRNDNVSIDVNLPFRLLNNTSASTSGNSFTTIDTITGITNNTNVFVVSYITAYKDNVDYGFWKRTIALNKSSNVVSLIGENVDFDRASSGLTPTSVVFVSNSGDLDIKISGESSKNYTWTSNWEIIK